MDALHLVWALIVLVALCAWWLRGRIERGRREALEQRLRLGREKDTELASGLEAAQGALLALNNQILGYEERTIVFEMSAVAVNVVGRTIMANTELDRILRGEKEKTPGQAARSR